MDPNYRNRVRVPDPLPVARDGGEPGEDPTYNLQPAIYPPSIHHRSASFMVRLYKNDVKNRKESLSIF